MIEDDDFEDEVNPLDEHLTLTDEERRVVNTLKRLARRWPPSLWVFCNGTMAVLKKNADGERAMKTPDQGSGIDTEYIVASINIENDGGDY